MIPISACAKGFLRGSILTGKVVIIQNEAARTVWGTGPSLPGQSRRDPVAPYLAPLVLVHRKELGPSGPPDRVGDPVPHNQETIWQSRQPLRVFPAPGYLLSSGPGSR